MFPGGTVDEQLHLIFKVSIDMAARIILGPGAKFSVGAFYGAFGRPHKPVAQSKLFPPPLGGLR